MQWQLLPLHFHGRRTRRTITALAVLTLKVDMHAERLIIANAVMAVVTLTIGGLAALLIALTRWQAVHLLDATWFYRLLTLHGIDMLIAWMVFLRSQACTSVRPCC
ncbi:MAG: hypothetical protein U0V48_00035 [Anaerolineales bacterium]